MRTLSFPELSRKIRSSTSISECVELFKKKEFPLSIHGAESSLQSLLVLELLRSAPGPFLLVFPGDKELEEAEADLALSDYLVQTLPWWGTMPYRPAAPSSAVFGLRAAALSNLVQSKVKITLCTLRAFLTPVPPPDYCKERTFRIKKGGSIDTSTLADRLVTWGYTRVPRVQVAGEFALRGEVLDVLLPGAEYAHRVQFDFETVESVRLFDVEDQSGFRQADELLLFPVKELSWDEERLSCLNKKISTREEFPSGAMDLIEQLHISNEASGEELFYPLAFESVYSVLDYLPDDASVFFMDRERLENAQDGLEREYMGLYRKARRESEQPKPEDILLQFKTLQSVSSRVISFCSLNKDTDNAQASIRIASDPPRSFFGNMDYLKQEFNSLKVNGWDILLVSESEAQTLRLGEMLKDFDVSIAPLALSSGFALNDIKFLLIHDNEIFGRRKRIPKSLKHIRSSAIDTFVELNPGDFVVHVNYGIGLFKGIERIRALGNERDYIKLEYADEESVFVPIEQVNLVQRYIGNEGSAPRLDKLGSKSWENRKGRVSKSVEDIAEKLVELYAKRKAAQGFAFPADTEWQVSFEAAFPWEETEDQLKCVEDIKEDMESPCPMDRLVCGDVGYGKTEVAVRACFKAVMGGKQVAFLAPTTILAEQHYENFQERFAGFPVTIGMVSRFVEKADIKKTLEAAKEGKIDILVGTHRIIQKDVHFRDLGLLVIDEEQRFGVKDKERLKELKTNVDALTLSATPIPRTLHMSLLKIRDMSLLATPPHNRHPVETIIDEFNEDRVAAAIRREAERGGQIFFLHNRVESLPEVRRMLERIVPELMIDIAHGQMAAQELEDIMHRFIHGGFHVLVSTTIIENGIDIPNVNTIIIDRADMYGVSQLYQLRGRVGRSDRVAHALLLYPKDKALSELAMRRLQVISDFTELGSGFKIAMKDMEIRGAGNLLGREQSGDIYSVGFDMYLRLLDEAVRKLQDENYQAENETLLELEYTGFIPNSYIDSAQEKMEVYKKIASIQQREELERIYAELIDRFGPLPEEVQSLLSLSEIKVICKDLSVSSLKERGGIVRVEFSKVSKVKVDNVIRLMKESQGRVKLDPHSPNILTLQTGAIGLKEKSEFIREKLAWLAG